MFNLSGGEIVVLLLIGLVVLGPEKLPEAMRKFGRVYNEVRRIAGGIQRDVTSTFAEPVDELRKTANEARKIFSSTDDPNFVPYSAPGDKPMGSNLEDAHGAPVDAAGSVPSQEAPEDDFGEAGSDHDPKT